MSEPRHAARTVVCRVGHTIAPAYTLEEARSLEVIVFYCETCREQWTATPEERDAFLQYLEARSGDAVPP